MSDLRALAERAAREIWTNQDRRQWQTECPHADEYSRYCADCEIRDFADAIERVARQAVEAEREAFIALALSGVNDEYERGGALSSHPRARQPVTLRFQCDTCGRLHPDFDKEAKCKHEEGRRRAGKTNLFLTHESDSHRPRLFTSKVSAEAVHVNVIEIEVEE